MNRPDRSVSSKTREKALDKTIADSFPSSDPPSSMPDPSDEITEELPVSAVQEQLTEDLPPGSWAAISIKQRRVVGTGATRGVALDQARRAGHGNVSLIRVAQHAQPPSQIRDLAS
jgi:hypothetical protein